MRCSYTSNNTYQTHKHWSQCVEPFKHQQIIFQLLIFTRLLYMFTKEGAIPTPSFHLLSPLVCKGISWLRAWLPWLPEADAKKRRAGYSSPSKIRAIFHLLFVVLHSLLMMYVYVYSLVYFVYLIIMNKDRPTPWTDSLFSSLVLFTIYIALIYWILIQIP